MALKLCSLSITLACWLDHNYPYTMQIGATESPAAEGKHQKQEHATLDCGMHNSVPNNGSSTIQHMLLANLKPYANGIQMQRLEPFAKLKMDNGASRSPSVVHLTFGCSENHSTRESSCFDRKTVFVVA